MSNLRWQYVGGETLGSTPVRLGSRKYRTRHIPPSQRYVRNFREPVGRVFPFDNGNGLRWCCITYTAKSHPIAHVERSLTAAKRYVEKHAHDHHHHRRSPVAPADQAVGE